MKYYRDEGLVVGGHKLGEADRIVILLTRHHGLVRAVAKGVRRTKSRFGSRLEPFMLVDFQAHVGRSLDVVTQVELVEPFAAGIGGDYDTYTAAAVMAETAMALTREEPHTRAQYLLLVSAIRSLVRREHPRRLARDAYLLRAMSIAGWAPSLVDCAQCGEAGPHKAFSAALGGAVCPACRGPQTTQLTHDAVTHLGALLSGDWATAEATGRFWAKEASRLVSSYVQFHLERHVRSLSVMEDA